MVSWPISAAAVVSGFAAVGQQAVGVGFAAH